MDPHLANTPRKLSAAHLAVPSRKRATSPSPTPTVEADAVGRGAVASDVFCDGLRDLLGQCGTNKHDLVTVLISACIEEGINTRKGIISTANQLGYNANHAAIVLAHGTGNNPERHSWCKSAEGIYGLLG